MRVVTVCGFDLSGIGCSCANSLQVVCAASVLVVDIEVFVNLNDVLCD